MGFVSQVNHKLFISYTKYRFQAIDIMMLVFWNP